MDGERLFGKVALVTGASSGIGEATAQALAAEGARVAVAARRTERITHLKDELELKGGSALAIELDVTDEESCATAIQAVLTEWGRIDILVNNAGVMLLGPVLNANTNDWRRMVSTNVLGLMYMTHAALPHLVSQGSGDIVQLSSLEARAARTRSAVYGASKSAVNAFSEALRQEVTAHGVRVTIIEPGTVATELADHITDPDTRRDTMAWSSSNRPLAASDVANAVVFALTQPEYASVNEVLVRPTDQVW